MVKLSAILVALGLFCDGGSTPIMHTPTDPLVDITYVFTAGDFVGVIVHVKGTDLPPQAGEWVGALLRPVYMGD